MQFGENFVAAVVGALSAILTSVIASWVSYRSLRAEYLGKHRLELISKQMAACEALWAVLEPASRSEGEARIIVHKKDQPYIVLSVAKKFYDDLNKVFNSTPGLYYSRQLRTELFDLRNFIMKEFISEASEDQFEVQISKSKEEKFDGKVQQLRIAIRAEIGVKDLKVTSEGPIN